MSGKFENVVIVTDMDGTYISHTEEGVRRNLEKIEYFKANGGCFTFATGRGVNHVLIAQENAAEVTNLPVICCNGAVLYDLQKDEQIAVYPIDHRLAYELHNKFDELTSIEGCENAANGHKSVLYKKKEYVKNAAWYYDLVHFQHDLYEIMTPEEWDECDIHKIGFVGERQAVTNIRKHLDPLFEDRFSITQASPRYYEFNAYGVSKAAGIKKMLGLVFGDKKTTLCVAGDYDNDIEMLKLADLACCPENANDRVKAVCHKCFCHHDQGLIADIIEYLDTVL